MNDLGIFLFGCLVSLIVLAAVGLLLWGAANEPRGSLIPHRTRARVPRATKLKVEARVSDAAERIAG